MKRRWTGDRLAALQVDYENGTLSLAEVSRRHVIHPTYLCTIAKKYGWAERRFNARTPVIGDRLDAMLAQRDELVRSLKETQRQILYLDRRIFAVRAAEAGSNPIIDVGDVNP